MGTIVVWTAYGLGIVLLAAAILLMAHGFLQIMPGAYGNSLRRILFHICHPWLKAVQLFIAIRIGNKDYTVFLVAILLLACCRYGIPWLVLWGYSLKG